jgi:hypothetical protein
MPHWRIAWGVAQWWREIGSPVLFPRVGTPSRRHTSSRSARIETMRAYMIHRSLSFLLAPLLFLVVWSAGHQVGHHSLHCYRPRCSCSRPLPGRQTDNRRKALRRRQLQCRPVRGVAPTSHKNWFSYVQSFSKHHQPPIHPRSFVDDDVFLSLAVPLT